MSKSGTFYGKYPAIVESYDANERTCIVNIPNITDGDGRLVAEIEYPVGDRSGSTEIKVLSGDMVWCEFIQGDARYPIITGYRNARNGNSVGVRHFEHDNINFDAGNKITLSVGSTSLTLTENDIAAIASSIGLQGKSGVKGGLNVDGIEFSDHIHVGKNGDTTPPK